MLHDRGPALSAAAAYAVGGIPGVKQVGPLKFWKRESCRPEQIPPFLFDGDEREQVKLVLHLSGEATLEGGGRLEPLMAGSWGLYAFAKTCQIHGPFSQLIVTLPKAPLAGRSYQLDRVMKRQFPSRLPEVAMAFRYFVSLYDSDFSRGSFTSELGDIGIRLLQVALEEQYARIEGRTREEKFRSRIKSFVDMHLHDPALTVEKIARSNKCSSRYLQKMFGEEESVSRYLWRMRLERCATALVSPGNAHRSITEITMSLGFSNSSHFSRVFRQRYGTTPREYRAAMMNKVWWGGSMRGSADKDFAA